MKYKSSKTAFLAPKWMLLLIVFGALAAYGIASLLISIFEHKQASSDSYVKIATVSESTSDPSPWGQNWPDQYDTYLRTVDAEESEYGGSSAITQSKLDSQPWLKRLYSGYAFSLDYREARGHAYMLHDQEVTERVTKRSQSGACLHCHASIIPTYRRLGVSSFANTEPDNNFNWPAVMKGFEIASTMTYEQAHDELLKTPDGTDKPNAHPVSCVDCHDPQSMKLRITRPGFINGISALAASDDALPQYPSIERWRTKSRARPYDPNADATRQEMRTFVCAQCHVEYYCASKETLFFPWNNGLKVEQIESMYENHNFPDGSKFYDYKHGETEAPMYKAQHPEFELFSQGIHSKRGVSCADCHMPYERKGAKKISSHWVRSPLLNINNSCQTCHNISEEELLTSVKSIQEKTVQQIERAAVAMTEMLDSIHRAKNFIKSESDRNKLYSLQRKAMWRLDYISSENSKGFHADQEAMRILAESIDFSRQAQALALSLMAQSPNSLPKHVPVQGVTPTEKAPVN